MLRAQRGEGCSVIFELATSFKAKRKVNVVYAWFPVLPPAPSLSLSHSELEFWSAERRLPSFDLSRRREICLLYHFSLLIGSDWVFFVFLPQRSRIGRKITFNYYFFIFLFVYYFLFLTNFVNISLCADPMRRNPFFSILMKVSAPITSGERSHGRLLQSLFCVYDKLERDLFR